MLEFYVTLHDELGREFPAPRDLILTPQRYGARAVGGFDQAEIDVAGPTQALWSILRWLGYRIHLRNRLGSVVWVGYIDEVKVTLGAVEIGLALAGMYNAVAVAYSTTVNGVTEDGTTAWASDADSIARYGRREALLTLSEASLSQANAYRDAKLQAFRFPAVTRSFSASKGVGGVLRGMGLFDTLGWRYYSQLSGLEENGGRGGSTQALGQGLSASTIAFTNDGKIHDLVGRLNEFAVDHNVEITGAGGNNGTRLIQSVDSRKAQSYTSNTISLDPVDDIMDIPNDGFGFVQASDCISMAGSAGGHDGNYRVKSASADHLVVKPGSIGTQPAGNTITISRGNYIQVSVGGVHALPGASVTLTVHGQKIAQSFSLGVNLSWTVERILVKLQRMGSPGDSVTVQLCADSGGVPGTVIEQATVAASGIAPVMEWVPFVLTNVNSVNYGVTYWIVISRTGANSHSDFYLVDVDEALSYPRGLCKLWNGVTWVDRATNADLVFRVLGSWMTTAQIQQIATDVGPFFAAVDIANASGIGSNQYRNGQTTALDELIALIESGTSAGRRLLAEVTPERTLKIYEQPASTAVGLLMDNDGKLTTLAGGALEPGKLPHGQWVALTEIPPSVGSLSPISPFFVERAEYDCVAGAYSALEPQGSPDAWGVGGIREG